MKKVSAAETVIRRKVILDASLSCFLSMGFNKTSMSDISEKADIARTLIYLHFKNKSDLLVAIFDHLMDGRIRQAGAILNGKGSRKEKLQQAIEILTLEPWKRISGQPKSIEFFEACSKYNQRNYEKFETLQLKLLKGFFKSEVEAEVFSLSLNGALADTPTPGVLRKRLDVLISRFAD
jgi:AcrR family transcriptional regulator